MWGDPVPAEQEAGVWIFEPWDGRTWLVALQFALEFLRGDNVLVAGRLNLNQLFCLVALALSAGLFTSRYKTR